MSVPVKSCVLIFDIRIHPMCLFNIFFLPEAWYDTVINAFSILNHSQVARLYVPCVLPFTLAGVVSLLLSKHTLVETEKDL